MKHPCPVCGFKGLTEPPYDHEGLQSHEICPCCGFQFGFDEYKMQHEDGSYLEPAESIIAYRKQWLADGAVMFSPDCCPAQQQKVKSML
nr:hypothetical protein [Bacillus stercoris]